MRGLALPARTHRPLSLSLSLSASRAAERSSALIQLNRYYVASLILHASIAEITAQLLSLSYVYLISSDDGSIIRIFVHASVYKARFKKKMIDSVSVEELDWSA